MNRWPEVPGMTKVFVSMFNWKSSKENKRRKEDILKIAKGKLNRTWKRRQLFLKLE
jgi:hypothetical protein